MFGISRTLTGARLRGFARRGDVDLREQEAARAEEVAAGLGRCTLT